MFQYNFQYFEKNFNIFVEFDFDQLNSSKKVNFVRCYFFFRVTKSMGSLNRDFSLSFEISTAR